MTKYESHSMCRGAAFKYAFLMQLLLHQKNLSNAYFSKKITINKNIRLQTPSPKPSSGPMEDLRYIQQEVLSGGGSTAASRSAAVSFCKHKTVERIIIEDTENDSEASSNSDTSSDESECANDATFSANETQPSTKPQPRVKYAVVEKETAHESDVAEDEGGEDFSTIYEDALFTHEKADVDFAAEVPPIHEICYMGVVHAIVEKQIVIQSTCIHAPLDKGSILCTADRRVVGKVHDVFGPVSNPFYVILVNSVADVSVAVRDKIFFSSQASKVVPTAEIMRIKGCDASNQFDAELPEEEADCSDDEQESAKNRKRKRDRGASGNASSFSSVSAVFRDYQTSQQAQSQPNCVNLDYGPPADSAASMDIDYGVNDTVSAEALQLYEDLDEENAYLETLRQNAANDILRNVSFKPI